MVQSGMSTVEAVYHESAGFCGQCAVAQSMRRLLRARLLGDFSTAACVNLRFVVFSAHMRNLSDAFCRCAGVCSMATSRRRGYVMFIKRFAANQRAKAKSIDGLFGGRQLFNWASWQGASLLGIGLAQVVPTQWGLGFAGVLALLGVGCSLA